MTPKILQSATIVTLEEEDYYVVEIKAGYARLTPVNPRYGVWGDLHVRPHDAAWDSMEIKTESQTLSDDYEEME